jgi:phenylalanyl-tRNA synthetase beta chain
MRLPYEWLREWVQVPWEARELGERLTMAGFEVESLEPAAADFSGVVVAEILEAAQHPQADKLRVCRVSKGQGEALQIVCGASNARVGLKSALAQVGAVLPGGAKIKAAKLRGIESRGMLCSAKELGLAETSGGILELPSDAPVGTPIREYLGLDDSVLELNVTPNRGDALSVLGIAREVAALSDGTVAGPRIGPVAAGHSDSIAIHLDAPKACPRFAGRLIRGVNQGAATPHWMRERLRRAGVRSISPIVDVTNYVMLELGQPLHAYDVARLRGDIHARLATAGESLKLLDGREVALDPDVLVIADAEGAVGVAGIMGGDRTSVSAETVNVFLEAAYFAPECIAGRPRRLAAQTDASQRFERGVDPTGQERALERATALIQEIAGGSSGPAVLTQASEHLPHRHPVRLRSARIERLLGATVSPDRVEAILAALEMRLERTQEGWEVTPPAHRFDIEIEADLIEEVARIEGFAAFGERDAEAAQRFGTLPEAAAAEGAVLESLAARGYHEAINYAFVDPALQSRLFPHRESLPLANPIASDLAVMRVSLWPGLLRAALENQRRQQERVRLFEHGTRFGVVNGRIEEVDSLAGLAIGPRMPEQWGGPAEARVAVDFFDVKADLEALLVATGAVFAFEAAELSCLHPARSARIVRRRVDESGAGAAGAQLAGWIGELDPRLTRELGLTGAPIMFEIDFETALRIERPRARDVSRYPQVRRDIAVLVDETVTFGALRERVTLAGASLLREVRIFDVYRGSGVEEGRKSVALGLIFQDFSRTLTDEDVDQAVASVVADLRSSFGARIRE